MEFIKPDNFGDLNLSGRILNAYTNIPNQIYYDEDEATWKVKPLHGNSALFSAFSVLNNDPNWENHLIAWTGELLTENIDETFHLSEEVKTSIEHQVNEANNTKNIHPIWLLRKDQNIWRKYAENIIWPAFHYIMGLPSDGKQEQQWWYDYVKFNEAYASKVLSLYKEGDIIWVHDYYLLLLPELIKMQRPNAIVGLFLHCPFPSSEYFRALPKRQQLLDGMLGANKISFQNFSFARHFLSSCKRVLGCDTTPNSVSVYDTTILVDSSPIGIDIARINKEAFDPAIDSKVQSIKDLYKGKKIIIGRDRLDSVRGVVQKLQAFEAFLELNPEWRDKVVLIQVSSPGYNKVSKVELQVSELINHINGLYGTLNSVPIHHYQTRLSKEEYLALLRVADVGLITPVRDGINTTALEFVLCQQFNNSPLILSEFSGTSSVLKDAIIVNPWDSVTVARQIHEALLMTPDKKKELELKLVKDVVPIQSWINTFIKSLLTFYQKQSNHELTPSLNRPLLLEHYNSSHRRLFLFDYDGTLTPIVTDPAAAIPSARLISILNELSKDPKNQIWIISGRDQAFLEKWLGSNNKLGLSAEHGCFMKDINSSWVNLTETFDMSWQKYVEEIFTNYTNMTPGSNIEKKKVALTWHYRRCDPELGEFQAKKLIKELNEKIASKYDVEVMSGKANVEVRPSFVNKGEIVKRLTLSKHGVPQTNDSSDVEHPHEELPDFVLCLGDDSTDEDMFKKLKTIESNWEKNPKYNRNKEFDNFGFYTVKVGPASKKTFATSHLNDPNQVLDTLGLLVGQVSVFANPGTVELDDRGHLILPSE